MESQLVGLELSKRDLELAVGDSVRIGGAAVYADGRRVDRRLGKVTLSSVEPPVAAISRDGRVVGGPSGAQ